MEVSEDEKRAYLQEIKLLEKFSIKDQIFKNDDIMMMKVYNHMIQFFKRKLADL
ncbi:MAG: hypothetical protein PHV68_01130 [Candidatus Gastranaerophilales bacterium]|nr:hypothetical protein [Candidatus Gastranaerophilales bacterium]